MQWLIDLIKEWVIAQGYLTTSYIDRGDPPIPDFDKFDFIPDDAWHELDLSGIVPAGAVAVALSVILQNIAAGRVMNFRKAGNTGAYNASRNHIDVATLFIVNDNVVSVDADRKIEYYLSTPGWITIGITVKGWWL